MMQQARGEVVRVLPRRQQHDHRCVGIDAGEQVAALALAADEAVALVGLHRMRAMQGDAEFLRQHIVQPGLELRLHRPAFDIGGLAQVRVGDQQDFITPDGDPRFGFGKVQRQHGDHPCCIMFR